MSADFLFGNVETRECVLNSLEDFMQKVDMSDFCLFFSLSTFTCFGLLAKFPSIMFEALRWSLDPSSLTMQYRSRINDKIQVCT